MSDMIEFSEELAPFIHGDAIAIDQLSAGFEKAPAGTYIVRATDVKAEPSKNDGAKWNVVAEYTVAEGPKEGLVIKNWYTLSVSPPKQPGGKPFAPGIMEIVEVCAKVGKPLAPTYAFPVVQPHKAAKVLGDAVKGKLLVLTVEDTFYTDKVSQEKKEKQKIKVAGIKPGTATSAKRAEPDFSDEVV